MLAMILEFCFLTETCPLVSKDPQILRTEASLHRKGSPDGLLALVLRTLTGTTLDLAML